MVQSSLNRLESKELLMSNSCYLAMKRVHSTLFCNFLINYHLGLQNNSPFVINTNSHIFQIKLSEIATYKTEMMHQQKCTNGIPLKKRMSKQITCLLCSEKALAT